MARRDLLGREPYPQFEPMAFDEIDAEIRSARPLMAALAVLAVICIGAGLFWP